MAPGSMQIVANRYEIESELGRGGMGVVYLARDSKLGRQVALKQLALSEVGTGTDEAVRRFMREAQVMGSLLHPAIVVLYDVLEEGNELYLVMEYYPSTNLSDVVNSKGALPEEEVRRIGARLATGLAAAHAKGIVHRDVKPENVLIGADGAKLTDFGVARIAEGYRQQITKLTQSGYYVGTPAYMAPEVIKGGEALAKSDTFSLGLVLYFALTGKEPYQATDVASLLYQIVYEPLELESLQISSDLREILRKATAKEPTERPSASELSEWLEGKKTPPSVSSAAEAPPPVIAQAPVASVQQQQPSVAAPPPQYPAYQPQYAPLPKKDNRVRSLVLGVVVGSLIVFGLIAVAVIASRPQRGVSEGQGNAPPGFEWHESELGYRALIPQAWTSEVDATSGSEFFWSSGKEGGIVVGNLGPADPSIYSLESDQLLNKVRNDLALGEGYSIDDKGLTADPNASFGGVRAAKVTFEITGPRTDPRYKAEVYFFNKSEDAWAVVTFARRVGYESFRPAFSTFEKSFEVKG